ncbi:glutamyl-tRNA synthetase, putative [Babesia bigemina]|uniref:Glutamyl-tRNA synthetase, putative n=1 Tax=Babesia bigemina TaxID=5866 RepID=A0A061D139_BABBI|nr:glutamyl-tRNA synthetase, putative [Babesia bigemina]CDR94536.1 glutamyl-tRNA synthetase, putative [Babesia bigemina]|eukprot:XP_012766722.1 glutamyl-tRNA synthetase, putative [Babesia bigemina]
MYHCFVVFTFLVTHLCFNVDAISTARHNSPVSLSRNATVVRNAAFVLSVHKPSSSLRLNALNNVESDNDEDVPDVSAKSVKTKGSLKGVRVRFAPSPTGRLHVGNLRTFIYNYLFARKHSGTLILRIDDTDDAREESGSFETIISDLKWLGFSWDEGPGGNIKTEGYQQSKRQDVYKEVADLLLQTGKAYRCFCTQQEVQNRKKNVKERGIELSYDKQCSHLEAASVNAKLLSGMQYTVRLRNDQFNEDIILLRSNGTATYNFACAVDDHRHDISHVIRGVDHLTNTRWQTSVLHAVGTALPTYIHCALMRNKDLTKLAKRSEDAVKISDLRDLGICKLPIVNYLAMLGTKYSDDPECRDFDQLAQLFDVNLLSTAPISFDMAKLKWLNRNYITGLPYFAFVDQLRTFLSEASDLDLSMPADKFLSLVTAAPPVLKKGVDTMRDFVSLIESSLRYKAPRFVGPDSYGYGGYFLNNESQKFLDTFTEWAQQLVAARWVELNGTNLATGNSDLGQCLYKLMDDMLHSDEFDAIEGHDHLPVVRHAFTGETQGPPLTALIELWRVAEMLSVAGFVPLRERIRRLTQVDSSATDPVAERLFSPGSRNSSAK